MVSLGVHQLLNTLYVMTEGSYVHMDHETLRVENEGKTLLQVPLHHLGSVMCFGNIMVSPAAIHRCAADGRDLVFLNRRGRFQARVVGPTTGNVLLRQAQHQAELHDQVPLEIARAMVAAKIKNSRHVLMREARETSDPLAEKELRQAAQRLAKSLSGLEKAIDLDAIRGWEGEAAHTYFGVFYHLVKEDRETFNFNGRNRRPPRDPVNTTLSFLYTLLLADCVAAAEGVGLDPQVGFLHTLRPGRPALGLDLLEELRAVVADRLTLTLINRRQLTRHHFEEYTGGAVSLTEEGRRLVAVSYQRRKAEEVYHQLLDRKMPLGLVPHVQARLLARHLRGDLAYYMPNVHK